MMNWLRQRINNWLIRGSDRDFIPMPVVQTGHVNVDGLDFTVMTANGGHIVQVRKYDRSKDNHLSETYIITNDEDVAEKIGHILVWRY